MSVFFYILERIFGCANIDVEAVLAKRAEEKDESLDWRHSIVDLLKLLDIDSSHGNRLELAIELGYVGDITDSESFNAWLHKYVMRRLAETGGRVPPELRE